MSAGLAYLLGLVTLPALAAAATAILLAFSRSNRIAPLSRCQFCDELGWEQLLYPKGEHRLNISQWIADTWHARIRARRHAHRVLWQRHFEEHPRWVRSANAWKRFGLRPIEQVGR